MHVAPIYAGLQSVMGQDLPARPQEASLWHGVRLPAERTTETPGQHSLGSPLRRLLQLRTLLHSAAPGLAPLRMSVTPMHMIQQSMLAYALLALDGVGDAGGLSIAAIVYMTRADHQSA